MKDVILVTNVEGSSKHAIHEDAEATLERLHTALAKDDTAQTHKTILYENVLKDQLLPLLLAVRVETQPRLLSLIIRLVLDNYNTIRSFKKLVGIFTISSNKHEQMNSIAE